MRKEREGNKSTIHKTAKEDVKIRPKRELIQQAQVRQTNRDRIDLINNNEQQFKRVAVGRRQAGYGQYIKYNRLDQQNKEGG